MPTYPNSGMVRVSSITHKYNRGKYNIELGLGEVVAPDDWVAHYQDVASVYQTVQQSSGTIKLVPNPESLDTESQAFNEDGTHK